MWAKGDCTTCLPPHSTCTVVPDFHKPHNRSKDERETARPACNFYVCVQHSTPNNQDRSPASGFAKLEPGASCCTRARCRWDLWVAHFAELTPIALQLMRQPMGGDALDACALDACMLYRLSALAWYCFSFFFLTNHQSARVSAACWKMAGKLEPREVKSQEVVEDGEGSEGKGPLASRVEGREPSSPCPSAVRSHSIVAEFAAPWTVAHQTPSFRGFPGKNTGVGCLL